MIASGVGSRKSVRRGELSFKPGEQGTDSGTMRGLGTGGFCDGLALSATGPSFVELVIARFRRSRSTRILILVAGLWIINGFDLGFTAHSYVQGLLVESNPLAASVLPLGIGALIWYKILLVVGPSLVLLRYRHLFLVEIAAWGLLAVYVLVALRWHMCYELYALLDTNSILPSPALVPPNAPISYGLAGSAA